MKKAVVLALSLILALVGFSAFASGSGESTAKGEVLTIKKFGLRAVPSQRTKIFDMVEQKVQAKLGFPVKFEIMGLDDETQLTEKLNLMLASGELPDIFPVWWNEEIRKQGAARFTLDELKTYQPDTFQQLTKIMQGLSMNEAATWGRYMRDGKMVEVPQVWYGGQFPHFAIWRKDLLDKYGMDVPTNMADVEKAFQAFRKDFPSKYPYSAPGKNLDWQCFSYVFDSTGVQMWHWGVNAAKQIVPGWTQPEIKTAFAIVQDWYKKGYINPEFLTIDNTTNTQLFMNGDKMLEDWRYDMDLATPFITGMAGDLISKIVPGVKIAPAVYPQLTPGKKPSLYVWNPFHGGSYGYNRALEATPDKLHKIMQVQNYLEQDEDVYTLQNYGIKGESFDYDANGIPQLKDGYKTNDQQKQYGIGYWWITAYSYNPLGDTKWANPGMLEARKKYILDPNGNFGKNKIEWHIDATSTGTTDPEWLELNQKYGTDLNTKRDVYFFAICSGQKPVSAWDEYVQYWNTHGGKELEAAANRIWGPLYK